MISPLPIAALWAAMQPLAAALTLTGDPIGISKTIPKQGDDIVLKAPVRNGGERAFAGPVRLDVTASRNRGPAQPVASLTRTLTLQAGQMVDLGVKWRPAENGWYDLAFRLSAPGDADASDNLARKRVPVVARDLYFAWFGSPLDFKWCNVPCAVKKGEEAAWLHRGAYPCRWKGANCYRKWPEEKLLAHWAADPCIAIDEMGGMNEHTKKFIRVLRQLKREKRRRFAAVWFMGGAHSYWADVKDVVDLFMPERYINYLGGHVGIFDETVRTARECGVMDKMVIGLGINVRKDKKTGRVLATPTKADVLRQVKYLKRIAPDMPGLAFFTAYSAAPGVAKYADQLCEEYFLKPVLTFEGGLKIDRAGGKFRLSIVERNIGGMDVRGAHAFFGYATGEHRGPVAFSRLATLRAGERARLSADMELPRGLRVVYAGIDGHNRYSTLDASAAEVVVNMPDLPDDEIAVYLPAADIERRDVPLRFEVAAGHDAWRVVERDLSGKIVANLPCGVLPLDPGLERDDRRLVVWTARGVTRPRRVRLFSLRPAESANAQVAAPARMPAREQHARARMLAHAATVPALAWPGTMREGDTLTVCNLFYTAKLDLAKDRLASLIHKDAGMNALKRAWRLRCPGRDGFGPARIVRTPGAVAATIPFDSAQASGETRYVFFLESPFVEVARVLRPKAAWTLKNASEGCALEQRGGEFALQAGPGGIVRRGELRDGTKYRDLLFGYLGAHPAPDNADKAGWLDFSFARPHNAGLGVAIARRWREARSKVYDVTRLYDAQDRIDVCYVWNVQQALVRPQRSRLYLAPHGYLPVGDAKCAPPARQMWETIRAPARPAMRPR